MDLFTAAAQRDEAIRIVGENADSWLDLAVAAIRTVAEKQPTLTAADVWRELGGEDPRERRAMGAAICRAKAEGIIAPSGLPPVSTERANARKMPLWKSLLWRERNGYAFGNREKKAGALARAIRSLDTGDAEAPLAERAADLTPEGWAGVARIVGEHAPSTATVLRVLEILSESERRSA